VALFEDLEDMEDGTVSCGVTQEKEETNLVEVVDPICPLSSPVIKETN
jgi:hypothetical protein